MNIKFNYTAEDARRDWAGEERRTEVRNELPPVRFVTKRDHFALIVLAVFAVVAFVAAVVL